MHVSAGDSGVRVRQRADTQGHHPQTLWLPSLMRLSANLGRDQPKSGTASVGVTARYLTSCSHHKRSLNTLPTYSGWEAAYHGLQHFKRSTRL